MEQQAEEREQVAGGVASNEKTTTADEVREALARRYGIESAFVRVAQLAKILGISTPTIYAAMREGRFFLPHRMLCSMPAVRMDDLAEWYGRQEPPTTKVRRQTDEKMLETTKQTMADDWTREEIISRVLARVTEKHGGKPRDSAPKRGATTSSSDGRRRRRSQ